MAFPAGAVICCAILLAAPFTWSAAPSNSSPAPAHDAAKVRRRPPSITLEQALHSDLRAFMVPLPEASLAQLPAAAPVLNSQTRRPAHPVFIPGRLLVKLNGIQHVSALEVEHGAEVQVRDLLRQRADVVFAELDTVRSRQSSPSDPLFPGQWHHDLVRTTNAWAYSFGTSSIRIAIVDTPFQMRHPDLGAHTISGWDIVSNQPITESDGIAHSTGAAGLAAAVINNQIGIAGMANCTLVPININGAISEMYDAVIWAADRDIRVVNLSWDGADSPTLNEAGKYLQEKAEGLLIMSGVNTQPRPGIDTYPAHPYILAISMTDAADNMRSWAGDHIDFAAPGWDVLTTSIGGAYAVRRGTSFAAPLFSGAVALLLSIHPGLTAAEVVEILRDTALDLGPSGWDKFYGWGRIDVGGAAAAALDRLPSPMILDARFGSDGFHLTATFHPRWQTVLWRRPNLNSSWNRLTNAVFELNPNSGTMAVLDPEPPVPSAYYQIQLTP